jgi:sterol 3beta-glucosyltransferase
MHYGICTYGSRGDTQPYIALALGLIDRGHQVTLFANENFADFVQAYGIDFYPLPGNIEMMVHAPEVLGVLKSGNMISFFRELQKMSRIIQPRVNQAMLSGVAKPDVLVASPLAIIWIYSIAEKLSKKWAILQLSLPTVPTKAFPFPGFAFFNWPVYNQFTYSLISAIYWRLNKKDIAAHRQGIGLAPLKGSIIKKIEVQQILNCYAFSPSLIARPADWPNAVDITGFLSIPKEKRKRSDYEQPSIELINWLKKGDPPVYIGFGSIPIPDPELFSQIMEEIIRSTGERFIFCEGWSIIPKFPKHERVFTLKSIDHSWLLPQCRTAIIHGGIGTIGAVLTAKIPAIVLSVFGDQPVWGKLIARKNLGVHLPFRKISKEKLLIAIEQTKSIAIKNAASATGDQIGKEDALARAIDRLENYFQAQ